MFLERRSSSRTGPFSPHDGRQRRRMPMRSMGWLFVGIALGLIVSRTSAKESIRWPERHWPERHWPEAKPADLGLSEASLNAAREYALRAGGSGMIVVNGRVVSRWGDQDRRYDIKSASKSIGVTLLGVAISEGRVALDDLASQYHRSFGMPPATDQQSEWAAQITIRQLATHTAGFAKAGGYEPILFAPGTHWHYSDGGPNWLAECLTEIYRQDMESVFSDRVLKPLGLNRDDLRWRKHAYREPRINGFTRHEFGSGVHANVDAMARLGLLYLRQGEWRGERILAADFVRQATGSLAEVRGLPEWDDPQHGNASDHYGLLWWNNNDGTLPTVPRDAYWAWGLYDSLIVVMPTQDTVAVRCGERGRSWHRPQGAKHYDVLAPFLEPIARAASSDDLGALQDKTQPISTAPYPPSLVIRSLVWEPRESIQRKARGSDNWPLTWADDDTQYTAYGDGYGFEPFVDRKLSLGLARISGDANSFRGRNRPSNVEQVGDGKHGRKASGMLMVDGVLYMLARNAGLSQLAWSTDHGATWTWADWRFAEGFACPTFLNYGRNYAGAPDDFVYVYSFDAQDAYTPSDRMILARVAGDRIRDRRDYEFFVRMDDQSQPVWTKDIAQRGAVFQHVGLCYRGGITFNSGLSRYLWVQVVSAPRLDRVDTRFSGGIAVYDAPAPWGPWTTVVYETAWDVGPGETASFPTKWISSDGRTLHLVFSGDDHFSVRRATLETFAD